MTILDGKLVAGKILEEIKNELNISLEKPRLDIFLIGDNPASIKYVDMKIKTASEVGIHTVLHKYPEDVNEVSLLSEINDLNESPQIHGIMVQLPLPDSFNTRVILDKISPAKDVDGLTALNLGRIFANHPEAIICATPKAVVKILDEYKIDLKGKNVVVLGSSTQVGMPVAGLVLNRGATITICNKNTADIDSKIAQADIVISATGVYGIVSSKNIKQGAVVIDVGFSVVDGVAKGDINPEGIENVASALTPVPGGVGPVTVANLLQNTLNAWKAQTNV